MAEINSFPNNSSEYIGAEEVMHWLHGRTKGVYAGSGNAAVTAVASSMNVSVAPGIGWITNSDGDGICWWFESAITLAIDSAHSTLNRIDRIIVEWQTTDYAALPEVKVLKGVNASSPSAPALTNSSTLRQISLARISIPAGTTSMRAALITDERFDPNVCGLVTEEFTADTSMINEQYQDAIEDLYNAIEEAWDGEISDGSITKAKLSNDQQNKVLLLTGITCSATTGNFVSVSNAAITADHVPVQVEFAAPKNITTNFTVTTGAGTLTINGTCSSATTCWVVLIKKDN